MPKHLTHIFLSINHKSTQTFFRFSHQEIKMHVQFLLTFPSYTFMQYFILSLYRFGLPQNFGAFISINMPHAAS